MSGLQRQDADLSLAARAAWLHFGGGLSQGEVAKRLGVPKIKAHRLIARANSEGLVKISFDGAIAECTELEMKLSERFNLDYCEVAPDLGEEGLPVRALGLAGGRFLSDEIVRGKSEMIGVGNGRTLASCVDHMAKLPSGKVRFVSLMGGLTRNFAANPHDIVHTLASKIGAEAYVMPLPFFANSVEDREVMMMQRGVSEVIEMAAKSDLKFVGIGSADETAQTFTTGFIDDTEIKNVQELGGIGELVGHFFDKDGTPVRTSLSERTISVSLQDLKNCRIVAVAGGEEKTQAIGSILMSGLLTGLITDERTAKSLLN